MTLAFIAFHPRDYLADTMHLSCEQHGAYFLLLMHCWQFGSIPLSNTDRSKICKISPERFRKKVAKAIAPFFDENGENKRATAERVKAEKLIIQKALAGSKGGTQKAINRAKRLAVATGKTLAAATRPLAENPSGRVAIKNNNITTTFTVAAREGAAPANNAGFVPADEPAGLRENARKELRKAKSTGVSGETIEVMKAKGWI